MSSCNYVSRSHRAAPQCRIFSSCFQYTRHTRPFFVPHHSIHWIDAALPSSSTETRTYGKYVLCLMCVSGVCVSVCACIGSSCPSSIGVSARTVHESRIVDSERMTEKEGKKEEAKNSRMKWIRTKRSHFAFSAGKISVHKRIRLWANILNKFF